jgi:tRNA-uridine 2-sulfurtransferase
MAKKVAVGLSGGVDSSVAAALLLAQGHEVTGVYLTCWEGPGCRAEDDRQDALDVALQLEIPLVQLDFRSAYREKVYEYMLREYEAGRTPNPDVMCNREIKFGLFYDWVISQGFDKVATGHFARIKTVAGRQRLLKGVDEKKDQTYFLHQLREKQLEKIMFPIGHLTKKKVRAEAEKRQLVTAGKPDSTGICFIGEVSVRKFLEERIKPKTGLVMMRHKESVVEVGRHQGAWFSTIGQRHGLTIDSSKLAQTGIDPTQVPPLYVTKKEVEQNRLFVGTKEELETGELRVGELHWIGEEGGRGEALEVGVRIRHGGEIVPAVMTPFGEEWQIDFKKPLWAAAPGQAAVIYQDDICLGGGIIR